MRPTAGRLFSSPAQNATAHRYYEVPRRKREAQRVSALTFPGEPIPVQTWLVDSRSPDRAPVCTAFLWVQNRDRNSPLSGQSVLYLVRFRRGKVHQTILPQPTPGEGAATRCDAFKGQPIAALCSYSAETCTPCDRFSVIQRHNAGLARHDGCWHLVDINSHHRHPLGFDPPAPRKRVELMLLLEDQLAVCLLAHPDRVSLKGDPVRLSASLATNLITVIRKLTINALKHGALSVPDGMLSVRRQVVSMQAHPHPPSPTITNGAQYDGCARYPPSLI